MMKGRRKIRYIVIHHSATADGQQTLSWPAIRAYHKAKGWRDVGYHLGFEWYGGRIEGLLGRPWALAGAHARGRNADSLGVCVVGNFEAGPPGRVVWDVLVERVAELADFLRVPTKRIMGHREVSKNRICPGKFFEMDAFRSAVARKRKTK
jgi:hypothetical protein